MGSTKLKPCPFGCPPEHPLGDVTPTMFGKDILLDLKRMGRQYEVACLVCGATGPPHSTIAQARRAWNTRTS